MTLQRPPRSAAEIAALPALSDPEFDRYLAVHAQNLTPETLVYLLRECGARGNRECVRRCGAALVGVEAENGRVCGGHCEGIIRNLAKHYRLEGPELLREFRAGCYERLWRDISAGRNKCAHVESRFGAALKARAIDVARAMARRRKRDRDFSSLPDDPEMGVGHGDEKVLLDDAVLGEIEHQRLLAFIRELPSKQGRAAQLVWIERWQVESEDPAETTVAKLMNISGRMVRKHLSAAREKLMADASLRAILEDDGRI